MRRIGVGALAAAVLVAACQGAGSSPSPLAVAGTPSANQATVGAPAPSATASPTPIQTTSSSAAPARPPATPSPTPRPYPTGTAGAVAFVHAYEDRLIGGQYRQAWTMLGPGWQTYLGTMSDYSADRKAFMRYAGKRYTVEANPVPTKSLADWLNGAYYTPLIDTAHAVLVKVSWNALWYDTSGWEMWVVNPTPNGWELYEVR
jgi:hypothetical protein